jgi:hypothetical protein
MGQSNHRPKNGDDLSTRIASRSQIANRFGALEPSLRQLRPGVFGKAELFEESRFPKRILFSGKELGKRMGAAVVGTATPIHFRGYCPHPSNHLRRRIHQPSLLPRNIQSNPRAGERLPKIRRDKQPARAKSVISTQRRCVKITLAASLDKPESLSKSP